MIMETREELMNWVNGEAILDCMSWYVNDLIGEYVRETGDYDSANEAWEIYAERANLPDDWEA
jgi:hypothetical protein